MFKNTLTVLMYHHIGPVTDEKEHLFFIDKNTFAKQLDFIKEKGFHPVSLKEVESAYAKRQKLPKRAVLITLDDGWADNYTDGFAIIKEKKIPVVIFVSTGLVEKDPQILTWNQISEMHSSGLVEFASHGVSHQMLRRFNNDEAFRELSESKKMLEERLNIEVKSFCYPFGSFDKRIRNLMFEAGYTMDYGTRKGINCWPWNARKPLQRAHVWAGEDLKTFYRELKTGYKKSFWNLFIK